MNIESSVKATLTIEEKRTLAEARNIIQDLFSTMDDHGCGSSDYYTVLAMHSQYEGDEINMSELENIRFILDAISMSDSLKLGGMI